MAKKKARIDAPPPRLPEPSVLSRQAAQSIIDKKFRGDVTEQRIVAEELIRLAEVLSCMNEGKPLPRKTLNTIDLSKTF